MVVTGFNNFFLSEFTLFERACVRVVVLSGLVVALEVAFPAITFRVVGSSASVSAFGALFNIFAFVVARGAHISSIDLSKAEALHAPFDEIVSWKRYWLLGGLLGDSNLVFGWQ